MLKKNKVFVGVLALLLALSVGYALFSETITINGTATAKGNFDISITCEEGLKQELKNSLLEGVNLTRKEVGYSNDVCIVDNANNKVSFSVDLAYPGAARYFTIKLTNNGTMPALWEDFIEEQKLYGDENFDGVFSESEMINSLASFFSEGDIVALENPDGLLYTGAEEYDEATFMTFMDENGALKPKASIYFVSVLYFDSRLGGEVNNNSGHIKGNFALKTTYDVSFPFTQSVSTN